MVDPGIALAVFAGLCVLLAALLWPERGLLPRWLQFVQLNERVRLEDALKHVFACRQAQQACSVDSLAGHLAVSSGEAAALLSRLAGMGLMRMEPDGPVLTPEGARSAVRIVRIHRLWERYLADRTGVPATKWHDEAERMEHALSTEQADTLDARLGRPAWDPHGDPIPDAAGVIPPAPGVGLDAVTPGRAVEIVHMEDEPPEVYDALLSDGLALGGHLEIVAQSDQGIRVRAGEHEWMLDPIAARNVNVRELPPDVRDAGPWTTLRDVDPGERVRVIEISRACQGSQRRRLLDLGVVKGAEIVPELVSAAGDPIAYSIHGALIALRRQQAAWIRVERNGAGTAREVA
jgi:DtxR family Mn-dependent transcriptional regulator